MRILTRPFHIYVALAVTLTALYLTSSYYVDLPGGFTVQRPGKQETSTPPNKSEPPKQPKPPKEEPKKEEPTKPLIDVLTYDNYEIPAPEAFRNTFNGTWNSARDSNNLLLTDLQCKIAFPGLFVEIKRMVQLRDKNHIKKEELDKIPGDTEGMVRAMIYDQRLYIIATGPVRNGKRSFASLEAIQRAIASAPEPIPNIEFTMVVSDISDAGATWVYARKIEDESLWLMPDFGLYSWPEPKVGAYSATQMKALETEEKTPWNRKQKKLVWRGPTAIAGTLKVREDLVKVSANKPWSDVKTFDWTNPEAKAKNLISMNEHCKYKFCAHTEGISYSGRLKYLQNCESVIIAHKMEWQQHYHSLMISSGINQNFVEVERDWSDLDEKMNHLLTHDDEAKKIADNGVKRFRERYLTPAAEVCYWRQLIRGWKLVSFEPEFYMTVGGVRKWRGLPVEDYLLERQLEWEAY